MSGSDGDIILVKVPAQGCPRSVPWEEPLLHSTKLIGIYVSYSDCTLFSIQMVYQRGAELLLGENHGGGYGSHFEYIELAAGEVITCVRGQLGLAKIYWLELETNVRVHGPFGSRRRVPDGRDFCFTVRGHFAGFHGHSDGVSLCSIGVYVNAGASRTLVCPEPSSSSGSLVTYSSEAAELARPVPSDGSGDRSAVELLQLSKEKTSQMDFAKKSKDKKIFERAFCAMSVKYDSVNS